jgi:hypothetical protein
VEPVHKRALKARRFDSGEDASPPLPDSTSSGKGGYASAFTSHYPAPFSSTPYCKRRECFLIRSTVRSLVVSLVVSLPVFLVV